MAADGLRRRETMAEGRWPSAVIGLGNPRPEEIAVQWDLDGLRLQLLAADGTVLHLLGPFGVAEGERVRQALAGASGMTLRDDEAGAILETVLDRSVAVRSYASPRRRLVVLTGRRPRFLVRRKPGRPARRPLVYREPEIACGRGG